MSEHRVAIWAYPGRVDGPDLSVVLKSRCLRLAGTATTHEVCYLVENRTFGTVDSILATKSCYVLTLGGG